MHKTQHYLGTTLLGLAAILTAGCGDSPAAAPVSPPLGAIEITVSTASRITDIDPDGYFLSIDDGPKRLVGVDATITIVGLPLGKHFVRLDGLAPNCALNDGSLRSVDVIAEGTTSSVSFTVTCLGKDDTGAGGWDY